MQTRLLSILALGLAFTPLCADERDKPEAVQMFERLVQRIPASTDAHEVHEYVGKEFTYVFNAGNADRAGVQWTPFWIANRLYCIHRIQSQEPVVAVYEIVDPDLQSAPFTERAQRAYGQFKSLRKNRGSARLLDLHAVIDHRAKLMADQLSYKMVYTSKPKVTSKP